ncbi:Unknown protein sequence [Pseudomonas savastanoi pv. phaseolicola]|uniref:Uncharacterized protein n=1 Tax=Pseudomonas savastanoi pv. phaseolicola TaxID=319 RepID=A0ABD4BGI8_PSESH|nr:Unknown protein sequence [Pseudomonas savastanoi pv. phaseolicola]KPB45826.1 Unknown protein sequence [Pseudomonas savastanoi pv. phaseolicola]KPB60847.1 Unknown protein sequence [Pseudomonas savastanoi pv. phaseolicola]KPB67126.1 Unknown protein sequence [Pseudomonas amygdali pv. mellea]KPY17102.1 hypothetical protein ALO55_102638 [Pseudomonas savastanoi pv. phaseolicola]
MTFDLGHADDVDALQEIGLVGDRLVEFLGNRRLDAERLAGKLDAVGFSQPRPVRDFPQLHHRVCPSLVRPGADRQPDRT